MRPKPKRAKSGSPIDHKKRELEEQEEKVSATVRKLEALIQEAPRLQEEKRKQRREELASLSGSGQRRVDAPSAIERRGLPGSPPAPRRRLKRDRRYMQLKFFALCLVFIVALLWLYNVMR